MSQSIPQSLVGRVALVTGASSGIGRATAIALAAAGAAVAAVARRADRLDELVGAITAAGGKAIALTGDVSDEAVATRIVVDTVDRLGRLDIVVNSAGAIQYGGVENADTAEWRRIIDVNLMASLYVCKAAIAPMRAQGGGDIINVTSLSGRQAGAAFGSYAASKFGMTGMTEGMRQELGKYGIRVCMIEPGATDTEVAEGISEPNIRQFIRDYVRMEGCLKPEDVADVVLFIALLPPRANVSVVVIRPTSDTVAHPAMLTNEGMFP